MFNKIKSLQQVILKKKKSKKKIKNLEKNGKHINIHSLITDLKTLGLKQNDIVFVHSSLSRMGYVKNGANAVIDAFLNVIGGNGTLVIPTYYMMGTMYNTCITKNYVFDWKKSPTVLGAIPSEFLKRKGISRSLHPTHSVSAIGKYAKKITENHHIGNKTFGENSPWGKILELNGKILGIGINLGPTTQYHYIEDILGDNFLLKVKLDEIYKLKCKISKNQYIYVDINPLNPEIAKTRIDKDENFFIRNYFWEIFEKTKVLHIGNIGKAHSWWVSVKEFYDFLFNLSDLGITIYSTKDELINNKLYPFDLIKENLKFLK